MFQALACRKASLVVARVWEYLADEPPYLFPEKTMLVRKQQLEPDMEQGTGSKLGKECEKAVFCHSAYLTSM